MSKSKQKTPKTTKPPVFETQRPPPHRKDLHTHTIFADRSPSAAEANEPAMYFHNYASSRTAMSEKQWDPLTSDPSIPTTGAEDRVVVRKLSDAFPDTSVAQDSPDGPFMKRFRPGANFYPAQVIEACSWRILNETKKMHTTGFICSTIFDREIMKHMEMSKNLSFAERIDFLCKMIRESKCVAVNLLKDEKVITTIAAPFKLAASLRSNSVANKEKGKHLLAGRASAKKEREAEVEAAAKEKEAENEAAQAMMELSGGAYTGVGDDPQEIE